MSPYRGGSHGTPARAWDAEPRLGVFRYAERRGPARCRGRRHGERTRAACVPCVMSRDSARPAT